MKKRKKIEQPRRCKPIDRTVDNFVGTKGGSFGDGNGEVVRIRQTIPSQATVWVQGLLAHKKHPPRTLR